MVFEANANAYPSAVIDWLLVGNSMNALAVDIAISSIIIDDHRVPIALDILLADGKG